MINPLQAPTKPVPRSTDVHASAGWASNDIAPAIAAIRQQLLSALTSSSVPHPVSHSRCHEQNAGHGVAARLMADLRSSAGGDASHKRPAAKQLPVRLSALVFAQSICAHLERAIHLVSAALTKLRAGALDRLHNLTRRTGRE
jgi:hypothetical protein